MPRRPTQALEGERLEQYVIDVGATLAVARSDSGPRCVPFVIGGGGYLRQLHEERTLVGDRPGLLRRWRRAVLDARRLAAASRALGLRGDAARQRATEGIDFEDKMRAYPTLVCACSLSPVSPRPD